MKPGNFPQATYTLAPPANLDGEECGSLAVYNAGDGICVSLWEMNWKDRIRALLFGRVWLYIWSGNSQPPVSLVVERTVFIESTAQADKV